MEKDRARNVIRQIAEQLHRCTRKQFAHVKLQRVAVQNLDAVVLESIAQKCRKPPIFFNQRCGFAQRQRELRQRAKSRTELHEMILRREFELLDNPPREVLIVQEILPESFAWPHVQFGEMTPDLGKIHAAFFCFRFVARRKILRASAIETPSIKYAVADLPMA